MKLSLVIRILSIIVFLIVLVNCQGGGGGGGGGGGSGGGGGGGRGGSRGGTTWRSESWFSKIISGILVYICIACCFCCGIWYCIKGRAFRSNKTFIKVAPRAQTVDIDGKSIFQSGIWHSRYYQQAKWHEYHRLVLTFDSRTMTVKGLGFDDVGTFKITGVYSPRTLRIGLNKRYASGTGNPAQNLGHKVTIQLCWNPAKEQFEGKWYVQTTQYHGEDKFELKFSNISEPLMDSSA